MGTYIYCMVDTNNEYDYDLEGAYTYDKDAVSFWFNCGVKAVVILDAYSMALLGRYDSKEEWERSIEE